MENDFVQKAIETFKSLNWKPANPNDLSRPDIVVYGNLDSEGKGVVCVIDPQASLFKVEFEDRTDNQVVSCKVVRKYADSTNPKYLLDQTLDAVGGLCGELCKRVGDY